LRRYHPPELIEQKRDGRALEADELEWFLYGFLKGSIEEYQMSAMLMAIYFQGLSSAELRTMTRCIIESGRRLDFSGGLAPAADKHSTGGVGDKVSLILAPLLAEYGLRVPMMSGRGLSHSGGTLDKLDSIPGFRTGIGLDEFSAIVDEIGCAMIGQTDQVAPLDGRLYALRDVTGTVPSIPLISASIVSKKVAEGAGSLVFDVKVGCGAFMKELADARELAGVMVDLAGSLGLRTRAVLTAMDEPLGRMVGSALEVREAIDCLRGGGPSDLRMVTLELCAEAVCLAHGSSDVDTARRDLGALLDDGSALARFVRLVERQGGDPSVIDDPDRLPGAAVIRDFVAPGAGFIERVDARRIGMAAVLLGGGRMTVDDVIDPAVGFEVLCQVGQQVERGEPLVRIHAGDEEGAEQATRLLGEAVGIGPEATEPMPLILDRI